ncbi:MAG: septum site-determining protein MinC [Candidatus Obscuribacterales bacterium]|nr:septum site-determining protein MinC [Candidatus Obscuribacterales bacterium]
MTTTKIAIISQAEQGVLIDISGCNTLAEAKQYLTSTLQVSSQFWDGLTVDLNLGPLALTPEEVAEIMAIVSEVGVKPKQIFAADNKTRASLIASRNVQDQPAAPVEPEAEAEPEATAETDLETKAKAEAVPPMPEPKVETPPASSKAECATPSALVEKLCEAATTTENKEETCEQNKPAKAPAKTPAKATPKTPAKQPERSPVLFLRQTLRSGQAISHKGHLVIVGDVNPGAEIMAEGDITIWGALRGMAHAGVGGNTGAEIRALKFEPIQLRIAHAIARSPDKMKTATAVSPGPETARIVDGKIRISTTIIE